MAIKIDDYVVDQAELDYLQRANVSYEPILDGLKLIFNANPSRIIRFLMTLTFYVIASTATAGHLEAVVEIWVKRMREMAKEHLETGE